jgi:lactate dehydrogenase-like 2-hydroxyacid dehydrogenase
MAVLDDYHNLVPELFSPLIKANKVKITYFPETLNSKKPDFESNMISRLKPFTIISTMRERTPFPRSILSELPNLKLLLTTGPVNASIDAAACVELDIAYAGTTLDLGPNMIKARYSQTNEHHWAILLALAKNVASDDRNVKASENGGWQTELSHGLAGKTLGCLGLGRLGGQAAVTGMLGFGMDVICWSENLTQEKADAVAEKAGLGKGVFKCVGSKKELFEKSDILTVQYVLSERSRGLVGRAELGAMKKDALLVNCSRGPIVDEAALLECLKQGKIGGAALDVFGTEPLEKNSEWRSTDWGRNGRSKVVLSPHMGYVERDTMREWFEVQANNVVRWMEGKELKAKILPKDSKGKI